MNEHHKQSLKYGDDRIQLLETIHEMVKQEADSRIPTKPAADDADAHPPEKGTATKSGFWENLLQYLSV